jgi:hypothetical protein
VAITASAAGTRIDCDHCGQHVASHFLFADELRRLTGYVRLDDSDCYSGCALHVLGHRAAPAREGDRGEI